MPELPHSQMCHRFTEKLKSSITALCIALLLVGLLPSINSAYAATTTMPTTLSANTTSYVLLSSSGTTPSVSGFTTDVVITASVTDGTVKITTTTGLTAPTGYDSADWTGGASEIAFEGTQTNVNNALATLSYQGSTSESTTLELAAYETGYVYNPDNDHYYKYEDPGDGREGWVDAKDTVAATTFNGFTGYLVTSTSEDEDNFIKNKVVGSDFGGSFYLGATDSEEEGVWKWVTGPENGTQFWSGAGSGAGGSAVGGEYSSWYSTTEPNGDTSENYAEWSGGTKYWNDFGGGAFSWTRYVTEYGGLDGETATLGATETVITNSQNVAPTLSSSTPTDGATEVAIDANLVLTFDKAVDVESGDITIKTGNTTFETIDVTSGSVTGTGTTTITINPTSDMGNGVSYYVQIDATAFDDTYGNSYAGISDSTTYNFTTVNAAITSTTPEVSNLFPQNGSEDVELDTELRVFFSEDVVANSGDIRILRASDSALVETILGTSDLVSGSGTQLITINPATELEPETGYYIEVDPWSFRNAEGDWFTGILGSSWGFTTKTIVDTTAEDDTDVEEEVEDGDSSDMETPTATDDDTPTFPDVPFSHEMSEVIESLYDMDYISGYPDGEFKPDAEMNRAEFVKIVVLMSGVVPLAEVHNNCFPDVQEEWFAPYVCYAKKQGWVDGYGDGLFRPEQGVSFAELFKILLSMKGVDVDSIAEASEEELEDVWYSKFIFAAKQLGFLMEEEEVIPGTLVNRALASYYIYMLIVE